MLQHYDVSNIEAICWAENGNKVEAIRGFLTVDVYQALGTSGSWHRVDITDAFGITKQIQHPNEGDIEFIMPAADYTAHLQRHIYLNMNLPTVIKDIVWQYAGDDLTAPIPSKEALIAPLSRCQTAAIKCQTIITNILAGATLVGLVVMIKTS